MTSGKCENHKLSYSYERHGILSTPSGVLTFLYPKRYICTIRGSIGTTHRQIIFKGAKRTKTMKIAPKASKKLSPPHESKKSNKCDKNFTKRFYVGIVIIRNMYYNIFDNES